MAATPAQVPANATTMNLNYNYGTQTVPAIGTPTGGEGTGFFLTANENGGAISTSYAIFGSSSDTSQAVEAMLCPYLSTNNTSGGTIFGGIGVRATTPTPGGLTSGYWAEFRTDTSATYGNYINFYKMPAGGPADLLGRYYFLVGSGGVVAGSLTSPNESKVIKSPQATGQNTWIKGRLEAEDVSGGTQIRLIVDDVTIVDWLDATPVASGQGILLVNDYFTSLSGPAESVGLIYDYAKYDTKAASVADWNLY